MTIKNKVKKWLVPIVILIVAIAAAQVIKRNPPEARRGGPPQTANLTVEVLPLTPQTFQVNVESYGVVKPRTNSVLTAQVSGQVIAVSEQFRDGGFFEQGEVLVQLDDRDYQVQVKAAQANVVSAQQALAEEQARGEQALLDWQRLGDGAQPNDLVLRKPQLEAAKAQLLSAQAQLEKAQLDLARTEITAPYSGRVLSQAVDVGQVVSSNTQLATIYATDTVEIRLPIRNNDLPFIALPEQYEGGEQIEGAAVTFSSSLMGDQHWQGKLVRTESAIDTNAQQLYVVGEIRQPFAATAENRFPIKINQYVKAKIKGRELAQQLIIPNSSIYQGSYVYVAKEGVLERRNITVQWQDQQVAMVKTGLEAGDKLVLTPLGQVSSGTRVDVVGETPVKSPSKPQGKPASRPTDKGAQS